jgi:hypothetical protein
LAVFFRTFFLAVFFTGFFAGLVDASLTAAGTPPVAVASEGTAFDSAMVETLLGVLQVIGCDELVEVISAAEDTITTPYKQGALRQISCRAAPSLFLSRS